MSRRRSSSSLCGGTTDRPRPRSTWSRRQARATCRAAQPAVREALESEAQPSELSLPQAAKGGSSGRWTAAGRELPPVRRDRQREDRGLPAGLRRGARPGMGAIVLVPEIGLTPQAVGRFRARFGDRIAILHSALGGAERRDERVRISSGEARIVIGARSAVFAPVRGSASSAWTRSTMLRTSRSPIPATTRARWRRSARRSRRPRCTAARRHARRAGPGSNDSNSVDAWPGRCRRCVSSISGTRRDIRSRHRCSSSSRPSRRAAAEAILLLNRRGVAPALHCRACGRTIRCPNCDVSLVLHKDGFLRCHHCGYDEAARETCPSCRSPELARLGAGTQRLERGPRAVSGARADPPRRRHGQEAGCGRRGSRAVRRDRPRRPRRHPDGREHHFEGVALAAVIDADTGLGLPDFRAEEEPSSS